MAAAGSLVPLMAQRCTERFLPSTDSSMTELFVVDVLPKGFLGTFYDYRDVTEHRWLPVNEVGGLFYGATG